MVVCLGGDFVLNGVELLSEDLVLLGGSVFSLRWVCQNRKVRIQYLAVVWFLFGGR